VTLVTGRGEMRSIRMLSAPGDPETPMSDNEIVEKFERLVTEGVPQPRNILMAGTKLVTERRCASRLFGALEAGLQQIECT
jgi:hypothetical protein